MVVLVVPIPVSTITVQVTVPTVVLRVLWFNLHYLGIVKRDFRGLEPLYLVLFRLGVLIKLYSPLKYTFNES